ncbi:hypothetical protein HMPREF0497_0224 [Lentilactobacillus buchneri ATCC 11577]|uniref:Lipoprotein n=1 Tax=Lentilactobacillus hilgardii (strain ATCC 8290 / DSM 20176 / CCUG 30140 / JCM 1155 / KCTC 3500 / NBRC 15886 / NCIMB 8040 / NRRL B-1843 / 9) TaxID=1423757 RepID=C0XID4_LENH9|nr:hypothetical protein HMPREF0497_0224 [Lentilactobacillus buchneri ATCC 11577]EEI24864.1 hypothetical protein HMPREF0519_0995 [Lentilactobacillus hilgardii DSM 20176 = ATCC 8290]
MKAGFSCIKSLLYLTGIVNAFSIACVMLSGACVGMKNND